MQQERKKGRGRLSLSLSTRRQEEKEEEEEQAERRMGPCRQATRESGGAEEEVVEVEEEEESGGTTSVRPSGRCCSLGGQGRNLRPGGTSAGSCWREKESRRRGGGERQRERGEREEGGERETLRHEREREREGGVQPRSDGGGSRSAVQCVKTIYLQDDPVSPLDASVITVGNGPVYLASSVAACNLTFVVQTGLKRLREKIGGSKECSLLSIRTPDSFAAELLWFWSRKRVGLEHFYTTVVTLRGKMSNSDSFSQIRGLSPGTLVESGSGRHPHSQKSAAEFKHPAWKVSARRKQLTAQPVTFTPPSAQRHSNSDSLRKETCLAGCFEQKMAAAAVLCFALWVAAAFTAGLGCPELCTCADKYSRHFAECSYKDLAEVPDGLPPNVTTLSLSGNKIRMIPLGSFDNVTQVRSLWMANNQIASIEQGALTPLVYLRNFDISYNKIADFPWEDLQNLTSLQLLKMNHNEMVHLPRDAFSNLKDLSSLRLNNNKFTTIAEGTFDSLVSLSHLQIYKNPFVCTCSLDWLRDWISTTTISVTEQNLIVCAAPEKLKGKVIGKLPVSKCTSTNVTIRTEPDIHNSTLYEASTLVLTCEFTGNPKPLIMWSIRSRSQTRELALSFTEDDSAESNDSLLSHDPVKVFSNGTLVVSHLTREDGGNYSCSATNEFGRSEDSVSVEVFALPKPTPVRQMTTTPAFMKTHPSVHQLRTDKTSILDSVHLLDLKAKDIVSVVPTYPPTVEINSESSEEATRSPSHASKCGLTANTRYISNHVFNGSLDDIKQYTFDFGVIALGVSETEAMVRLNPLLMPRDKSINRAADSTTSMPETFHTDSEEHDDLSDVPEKVHSNGLYLCITADHKHSAVQWSRIKEGVNTYLFTGLRPGTNYSLCLTYRGEDCEVQVLFTTRRRVPNLLIIISVSICLLTVSTVPLLGATCFHLVYKYRSKTYKLIMKAKDQYHMERNLTANFNIHAAHTESQRRINGSQLDVEEGETETESGDGEKEADTEESVMTESFTLCQCRGNLDNCETPLNKQA
ncbi:hypothetical protein L3Q82_000145 [Scortum barcoo]|uniref:Uncharacterized protein n=1 Tax=Scortum barcoo TaxID=214431 RepID=A0ACB8XA30_9TELE|nr:hypothetical protein L3Q82_000145 [Scortum barcoo]